ncbi:bifunctional folylpolyglutamate synthase/dihydrofolate synthase [Pectinatus cerevisiiphilus]|uniref:tetrahydrofolate synthase n=1 Tax=Pectinatus cerevisiiphilus TaxID=86956 RepID=A0A4R3KBU7_9FIRM|nr:folylpolyglutamate synthase/dihydrofolate synthase family protein [Pectinatus cerevisiiphilus]TCS80557.1 dihydrofolate synthase/folylpolyglutamate synthase [Pectinatus cerevisiiphilus]
MDYQEALTYLDELNRFGVKLGLERIERLLQLLDEPQLKYKTIHVTGTNGKGSVCAMVSEIIHQSGIKTGLYISPHLFSYTERIQIDGVPVTEETFANCISVVKTFADQMVSEGMESPTQFEILTAAAFFCFAINNVEYAVIEVGLGGLLDSTNVIVPEVSVITNIAFEHADLCGGTLEGIAHHKAGIIKDGVPVVTDVKGMTLDILNEEAAKKNTDLFIEDADFQAQFLNYDGCKQYISFSSKIIGVKEEFALNLLGEHQVRNGALAIMTAYLLANDERRITTEAMRLALANVRWPGRFERFYINGKRIIIDGAHNPAGALMLRQNLDKYYPTEQRVFVLGILKDKAVSVMLKTLLRPEDIVIATEPNSARKADPAEWAKELDVKYVQVEKDRQAALDKALELTQEECLLCLAGSLYLIGELRHDLCLMKNKEPGKNKV